MFTTNHFFSLPIILLFFVYYHVLWCLLFGAPLIIFIFCLSKNKKIKKKSRFNWVSHSFTYIGRYMHMLSILTHSLQNVQWECKANKGTDKWWKGIVVPRIQGFLIFIILCSPALCYFIDYKNEIFLLFLIYCLYHRLWTS